MVIPPLDFLVCIQTPRQMVIPPLDFLVWRLLLEKIFNDFLFKPDDSDIISSYDSNVKISPEILKRDDIFKFIPISLYVFGIC